MNFRVKEYYCKWTIARMSRIAMTCLKTCLDLNSTKNIQKSPSHGNRARPSVAISPNIIGRF